MIDYKYQLYSLLNKVNKVTSNHRHGTLISKKHLDELSNRQIEVEKAIKPPLADVMDLLNADVDEHGNITCRECGLQNECCKCGIEDH